MTGHGGLFDEPLDEDLARDIATIQTTADVAGFRSHLMGFRERCENADVPMDPSWRDLAGQLEEAITARAVALGLESPR